MVGFLQSGFEVFCFFIGDFDFMLDQYICYKNKGNVNYYIDKYGVIIEFYGFE